jgi:hypothetical protein
MGRPTWKRFVWDLGWLGFSIAGAVYDGPGAIDVFSVGIWGLLLGFDLGRYAWGAP